ncbi:MAG: hypothetical protein FRX49_12701 [Trebouxia sp. A1-2]|nr:MAG: hypothetical protein FRX49_12701 [Trebouxia sp. A1-2]
MTRSVEQEGGVIYLFVSKDLLGVGSAQWRGQPHGMVLPKDGLPTPSGTPASTIGHANVRAMSKQGQGRAGAKGRPGGAGQGRQAGPGQGGVARGVGTGGSLTSCTVANNLSLLGSVSIGHSSKRDKTLYLVAKAA